MLEVAAGVEVIEDDGIGFVTEDLRERAIGETPAKLRLGLSGIRERLSLLGGEALVEALALILSRTVPGSTSSPSLNDHSTSASGSSMRTVSSASNRPQTMP